MTHQWIMGRRFNVVQTCPNSEALAATSAKEMGWVVLWPRYVEKRARPRRKLVEAVVPYLPGYIFVTDNRFLSLWELSKAKGVASVLRVGTDYAFVDDIDPVMRALIKMLDDDGFIKKEFAKKPISLYKKGDDVWIHQGAFAQFAALVESVSNDRKIATVWLNILGGRTLTKIAVENLHLIRTGLEKTPKKAA